MTQAEIIRIEKSDDCIRGVLKIDGVIECCTLERPYINNKRNVSAVPCGVYKVIPYKSAKFGNSFILKDVPGRSGILIHGGNTSEDTEGCILAGKAFGEINGKKAVLKSADAMSSLRERIKGEFELVIRE